MSRVYTYRIAIRREERCLARTLSLYMESGRDVVRRANEIDALPLVVWKGQRLHTLRCQADFGKGPHDYNLPESLLWALISLNKFRCCWHQ